MFMRAVIAWLMILGLFPLARAAAPASAEPDFRIDVLVSQQSPAYLAFQQQIERKQKAYQGKIRLVDNADNSPALPGIHHVLVVLGNHSLAGLDSVPARYEALLAIYVDPLQFSPCQQRLHQQRPGLPITALFRGAPLQRQLRLARLLLPKASRLAIPYATDAAAQLADLPALAAAEGFRVHAGALESSNPVQGLQALLPDTDAILALPELKAITADSIRSILLAAYRQGRPVIGMESSYVRAGVLATSYTTTEQYADATEALVSQWLDAHELPAASWPKAFVVTINPQVARSLGLLLPDESVITQQLQQQESRP